MKYIPNTKLITGALLMCATLSAQAQKDSVQVAPDITYTADHPATSLGVSKLKVPTSLTAKCS